MTRIGQDRSASSALYALINSKKKLTPSKDERLNILNQSSQNEIINKIEDKELKKIYENIISYIYTIYIIL